MSGNGPMPDAPDELLRNVAALCYVADIANPELSEDDHHHLAHVLRLRTGETIALADGSGSWRRAQIDSLHESTDRRARARTVSESRLSLRLGEGIEVREPPAPTLTVAFAVPKGDRLDLVVQKLTELGVDDIVPLVTRRTVVRIREDEVGRRTDRLVRIAREAGAQSRRLHLPRISAPIPLERFLADAPPGTAIAEPGGVRVGGDVTCIVVGPEGGWDDDELPADVARVGLGPNVLRAETAAIAAGVLITSIRSGVLGVG